MLKGGAVVDSGSPDDLLQRYGRDDLEEVFLDIARGVLASERVRCRVQRREYFVEDYLEADLRRHFDTLAHRFGSPALAIPGPRPLQLKELPWWRRRALLALLPKPDDDNP